MLVYLAHPVGTDPEERKKNLLNAQKWFLYLLKNTDWSFSVPWFIYVSNLDESWRKRAMRDDLTNLERCDAIVLTGGRMTPGMLTELGLAQMGGLKVIDLTGSGYEPPQDADTAILAGVE